MASTSRSSLVSTSNQMIIVEALLVTTTIVVLGNYFWKNRAKTSTCTATTKATDRTNAGATLEGKDLSLFYGDVKELTTITPSRKFLPDDIYSQLVLNTVVCCVDILLVNVQTKQCLVVLRGSEPVKGVWWLPGGRLLKGETFFDAAKRKARDETGVSNVTPIQVLGVWNTFFPTSNWDTDTSKGTQTVNPIVLVEMNDPSDAPKIKLDGTSESYRWISLDPLDNPTEDRYVLQGLLRLRDWNPNYIQYK